MRRLLERIALSLVSLVAGAALLLWLISTQYLAEPDDESELTGTSLFAPE
jgi:hypothetical protein